MGRFTTSSIERLEDPALKSDTFTILRSDNIATSAHQDRASVMACLTTGIISSDSLNVMRLEGGQALKIFWQQINVSRICVHVVDKPDSYLPPIVMVH